MIGVREFNFKEKLCFLNARFLVLAGILQILQIKSPENSLSLLFFYFLIQISRTPTKGISSNALQYLLGKVVIKTPLIDLRQIFKRDEQQALKVWLIGEASIFAGFRTRHVTTVVITAVCRNH